PRSRFCRWPPRIAPRHRPPGRLRRRTDPGTLFDRVASSGLLLIWSGPSDGRRVRGRQGIPRPGDHGGFGIVAGRPGGRWGLAAPIVAAPRRETKRFLPPIPGAHHDRGCPRIDPPTPPIKPLSDVISDRNAARSTRRPGLREPGRIEDRQ